MNGTAPASTARPDQRRDPADVLRDLPTLADRIRYACEHAPDPSAPAVRAWLAEHGVSAAPSYLRSTVAGWRRERDEAAAPRPSGADTSDLPRLTPQLLAELDAITGPAVEPEPPAPPAPVADPTPPAAVDTDAGEGARATRGRLVAWLAFATGGLVSVAANVAHTLYPTARQLADWTAAGHAAGSWRPPVGAMVMAAFWPVALILAVEVLTRVSWRPGAGYGWSRYAGTSVVAAVAAVMSYRHMAGLLALWGEDGLGARLGPLAVDGLMVVAAAALLSTSRTAR